MSDRMAAEITIGGRLSSDEDLDTHWIANTTIATALRAMAARHVIVVADSCYSGTLTRGIAMGHSDVYRFAQ